jgi:hypothetical protein
MTGALRSAVFEIEALACAQTVQKLLNYFAQRDILPGRVEWETSDNVCKITIETQQFTDGVANIIAEKMRCQVNVQSVHLRM